MSRRLYLAPFEAHETTTRLLQDALALVSGPDYRRILYLAPSPRKLRDTEYRFARLCGVSGYIPPSFLTPGQLARQLYADHGNARPISAALRPLLIHRLVRSEARTHSLGYAQALAEFIGDIKSWVPSTQRAGLRKMFESELAGYEKPLARLLEALDILERYDTELADRNRVDDEDILAAAPAFADHRAPGVLILDSFAAPDPAEAELLTALVNAADTTLAVCFAGDDNEPGYEYADRFRMLIEQIGGFSITRLTRTAIPQPDGLNVFPDPEQEIIGICRHLRNQDNLADTVVALPDLSSRAPLVQRVFRQYGLSATVYPKTRLDASPPVIAVLDLLEAIAHDFERLPTAAAFSSSWLTDLLRLPADKDDINRNRAAAAVNGISRRAGIIKGRDNWRNIATRLALAERRLSESESALAADLQARVRRAVGLADKLLEPSDTIGRQSTRLKTFLEAISFGVGFSTEPDQAPSVQADRGSLYDILDELVEFETEFGSQPETRAGFIRALRYLVGLCPRTADPVPRGVLVVSLSETIGLHPGHVVIGGLTETNIPGGYAPDLFLPERLRRRLGMPDSNRHHEWQRFNLFRAIGSGRDAPFLCYYNSSDSKPVLPSPLLDLSTRKPENPKTILSDLEAQMDDGTRNGLPFIEHSAGVDYSNQTRGQAVPEHDEIRAVLEAEFGPNRQFSVTGLETYRACPYRYYLEKVLGLDSPTEPQYQIDSLQWGNVIHDALSRLYARGPVPTERLADHARTALSKALDDARLPEFWAETARRVFDNLLPAFIRTEQELRDAGWQPEQVELPLEGRVDERLIIRGRADRVDVGPQGRLILDYKTGQVGISPKDVVEHRTHLQLPLYARLLDKHDLVPVANIGVYSLRDSRVRMLAEDKSLPGRQSSAYPLADLIKIAVETAVEAVNGIRAGRFPAEPARNDCRHCANDWFCGVRDIVETD